MSKTLASLMCMGLALPAFAQSPDIYQKDTLDAPEQLAADRSEIPAGAGAVFVPSLSAAGDEPSFYVVSGTEIYQGAVGQRVAVPPGRYVVLVGSSDPRQSASTSVEVAEGATTLVPINYGGLRVDVVDRRLRPVDNVNLELIHEESGNRVENWPDLGDDPETRLLKPGAYRIQKPGSDGVSAPDFASVYIPEGGLAHLRVFVDNRGELLGAGIVPAEEVKNWSGPEEKSPWRRSLVIGVDGSFVQNKSVIGRPDFTIAEGSAFIQGNLAYVGERHLMEVDASLNEGVYYLQPSTGRPLPIIKSTDKLQADARYTLLLNEGVGFYAGAGGETQILPTWGVTAEDVTVAFQNRDGSVDRQNVEAGTTYRVADPFNPLLLRGGTGLRIRFSTMRDFDLSLNGGAGFRSYQLAGAYMPLDDPGTAAIEYLQLSNINRLGLEAGATATIRLTNFMTYTTNLQVFTGLQNPENYIAAWDNDVSLAITRAISVHYRANLDQIREFTPKAQLNHGVFVRAAWNVL